VPGGHLGMLTGRAARTTTWVTMDEWIDQYSSERPAPTRKAAAKKTPAKKTAAKKTAAKKTAAKKTAAKKTAAKKTAAEKAPARKAPAKKAVAATDEREVAPDRAAIGSNPERRFASASSRSLARRP
jgi:polyhydroxyalkanoate synthase